MKNPAAKNTPTQQDTGLTAVAGALTAGGPAPPPNPWVMHGKYISYAYGVVVGNAYYMGDGTLNAQALYINGQPVTSMLEAPTDGQTYGRSNSTWVRTPQVASIADIDGVSPSTVAVVTSNGLRYVVGGQLSTLTTLNKAGLISAINELNSALKAVSSGVQIYGSFNATTGAITWNTASGESGNALPTPAPPLTGKYITCSVNGTTPPTGAPAGSYLAGDQLLCDGTRWTHVQINSGVSYAASIVVSPAVLGQVDVQAALASLQVYANTTDVGTFPNTIGQSVQSLRSSAPNSAPADGTRHPGELWVNFSDKQIGVVDDAQLSDPLLAVRFFSTLTNYAAGDHVVYSGALYRAVVAVIPGAFNPAQWAPAGGSVTVGDNPPANPQPGSLWWDSVGAQLYIWYDDGTSRQWVLAVNQGPPANLVTEAPSDGNAYGRDNLSWVPVLPIAGGTLGGPLIQNADPVLPLGTSTKQYTDTKLSLAGGVMQGMLTLFQAPTALLHACTKAYADLKLALTGGTLTGPLTLAGNPTQALHAVPMQYPVAKAGDTMTGPLTLYGPPTNALHAATKNYVDLAQPIGGIITWSGGAPPTNWLLCDGTVYNNSSIPLLAPILNNKFGGVVGTSNAVPPMMNRFVYGGTVGGALGGVATVALDATMIPPHNHGVSDPGHNHGHSDPGHAHSVYDPTHIHGVGDPGHNHGLNDPGHAHGAYQDAHSHGLDHQVATSSSGGQVAPQVGGWLITTVRTDAQQPAVHVNAAGTGCYNSAAGTGLYLGYAATGISIYAAGTGIANVAAATGVTTQNTGGGAAHTNMPPYITMPFIIRYQ